MITIPRSARKKARAPLAASKETHRATVAFIADIAAHDESEDLHPARLDAPAADLDAAIADEAHERTIAERTTEDGMRS